MLERNCLPTLHDWCVIYQREYVLRNGLRTLKELCLPYVPLLYLRLLYWHGLNLIPALISYYISRKVLYEIIYPFANFNDSTVEVLSSQFVVKKNWLTNVCQPCRHPFCDWVTQLRLWLVAGHTHCISQGKTFHPHGGKCFQILCQIFFIKLVLCATETLWQLSR